MTSFGRVRHRLAQVLGRSTGTVIFPLVERLKIELDEHGIHVSWPTLMRDLSQVRAVHVETGVRPPSPVTMAA